MNQAVIVGQLEVGGIVLSVLAASLLIRRWILGRLRKAAFENPKSFTAVLHEDLKAPTLLWCLVITADAVLNYIALSERATRLTNSLVVSFLILSLTMVTSSVLMRGMQRYGEQHHLPFAVAGLSRTLTRVVIFGVGLLVLLRFLGISITPVLGALGVGGLAVALALQDTLANVFAGVHILVERPIAVGDYVRLSADEEGTVADIGWRTTRLLTGTNNMIVIPNKTITSGNLLNYSMPELTVGTGVPVMLDLRADVAKAEKVAVAAALAIEGVVQEPPPLLIADPGIQPTHLQYKLVFRVPAQVQAGLIRTRVTNLMLEGFRKQDIALPDLGRVLEKRA